MAQITPFFEVSSKSVFCEMLREIFKNQSRSVIKDVREEKRRRSSRRESEERKVKKRKEGL